MFALPKHLYTLEEYFDLELNSDERFEYLDGKAFSMSGLSSNHAAIEVNLTISLGGSLRRRQGCSYFPTDMRLKVQTALRYRYANGSTLCGTPIFEKIGGADTPVNPQVIIEILSDSTAEYDRTMKFKNYKSVENFREHLLISQDTTFVRHFCRPEAFWTQTEYSEMSDEIWLESIGCGIPLADVYDGVTVKNADAIWQGEKLD
jgi:Uma2 family endonuclease